MSDDEEQDKMTAEFVGLVNAWVERDDMIIEKNNELKEAKSIFNDELKELKSQRNQIETYMLDYMAKTDGLIPTKEEARIMMSAAMLAGATDFLSDKIIGSSSGLLSKMAKGSAVTKPVTKGAKDTLASQVGATAKTILL